MILTRNDDAKKNAMNAQIAWLLHLINNATIIAIPEVMVNKEKKSFILLRLCLTLPDQDNN